MENVHSSDGIAEDIIRSFTQIGCAEYHAKTLLEKYLGEMENKVDPSDTEKVNVLRKKIEDTTQEIGILAELRRGMMLRLFDMYQGDKSWWCMVKHLSIAANCAFEAYEASDDDIDLLDFYLEANKRLIHALSHFLGVEISECAACFAEAVRKEKT